MKKRLAYVFCIAIGLLAFNPAFSASAKASTVKSTTPKGVDNLVNVINQTLLQNPRIIASRLTVASEHHAVREARGAYFPQIALSAEYGRERTQGQSNNNTLWRKDYGATLTQLLFDGGATSATVAASKANYRLSQSQYNEALVLVAQGTVESYINVLRWRAIVAAYRRNVASHVRMRKLIRQRTQLGAGKISDQQLIESRLALARSRLENALEQLEQASFTYEQFTGELPKRLSAVGQPGPLPATLEQALHVALRNNPSLQSSREQIEAARQNTRQARAAYWPTLDLNVSKNFRYDQDGTQGPNHDAMATVSGNYTVWDGGARGARVKSRYQAYLSRVYDYRESLRATVSSVKTAWSFLKRSGRDLAVLARHKKESLEVYHSYRQEFDISQRTLFDLLNSESEYYNASVSYINARSDWLFDHYRLLGAMGTIVPYFNDHTAFKHDLELHA